MSCVGRVKLGVLGIEDPRILIKLPGNTRAEANTQSPSLQAPSCGPVRGLPGQEACRACGRAGAQTGARPLTRAPGWGRHAPRLVGGSCPESIWPGGTVLPIRSVAAADSNGPHICLHTIASRKDVIKSFEQHFGTSDYAEKPHRNVSCCVQLVYPAVSVSAHCSVKIT